MGKLTTHVLDTMHGKPAVGVRIELFSVQDNDRVRLADVTTNGDGRCDQPLLQGEAMKKGVYELVLHMGDYFAGQGARLPTPRFVDQVVLRFGIAHPQESYHVPLVATPWTWSTYRGS